jgi:hypothetical protein
MISRRQHLTESEFVDLLDGTLDDNRRRHLDGCDQCAAQAADLVAGSEAVRETDVPEPPPFFWTQFSARVSEAVSNEAAKPRIAAFGWLRAPWMGPAAAAAVMVLCLFLALSGWRPAPSTNTPVENVAAAHPDAIAGDETLDVDSDEAWALVQALAEDLDDEQMNDEGVSAGAGAAERMTWQLTEAERIELARLIREQLRLAGVPETTL